MVDASSSVADIHLEVNQFIHALRSRFAFTSSGGGPRFAVVTFNGPPMSHLQDCDEAEAADRALGAPARGARGWRDVRKERLVVVVEDVAVVVVVVAVVVSVDVVSVDIDVAVACSWWQSLR